MRPRFFTLLLFGRETQRFIPGATSLFSIYPGKDRSDPHAERHELAGTLLYQATRLHELLDVQSFTAFDKTDAEAPNAVKYPRRALYEAMGNALAHRDYEATDPTRLTVFDDRIEILSPGALPFGVDPAAFSAGQAAPKWRNQALAWFFNRLQLAQAEGQGIPTILRAMREEGCPPPDLRPGPAQVLCILPAHPRHSLLRSFREIETLMALDNLEGARSRVRELLDQDRLNARGLQLFAEIQQALREPVPVAQMLDQLGDAVERLPASVLVAFSDALGAGAPETQAYTPLRARLLRLASRGRLEERELRRLAVSMLRMQDEQAVLTVIENNLRDHPEWLASASVLQLRGDAYLGLAKKCSRSARKPHIAAATRDRIRREMKLYLDRAEADLRRARELSMDTNLTQVIDRNLAYLQQMRQSRPGT